MNSEKAFCSDILKAVAEAKAAYEQGHLHAYKPLEVAGTGHAYSTCMTSWGPLMKR